MAHRSTDNGRDETHGARRTLPAEPTAHREADVAPPGSRERAESDLTGWNPARDEDASTRQGRYYRAATMRMAQPRTQVDDGPRPDLYGTPPENSGPYGLDDRDSRYATGWGPRHDTGEQDVEMSRQRADYRPWDRSGYGGDEPARPVAPQAESTRDTRFRGAPGDERHGDARPRYRMDRSPSDAASFQAHRGSSVGPSDAASFHAHRGSGVGPSDAASFHAHRGASPGRDEASTHPASAGRDEASTHRWSGADTHATSARHGPGADTTSSTAGARREPSGTHVFYTAIAGRPDASTPSRRDTRTDDRGPRGRWQHEPLNAREVMTRNVRTARPESPLRDVAQIMKDESCGAVPIVDERGRLVGIVTDRDLVVRAFTEGRSPEQLRVSDVMTDDVEAVTPDDTLHDVIGLMGRRQLRRIPVVERDDCIVGIISLGDIALRADHDEALQQALERISAKRSFWSRLG